MKKADFFSSGVSISNIMFGDTIQTNLNSYIDAIVANPQGKYVRLSGPIAAARGEGNSEESRI